MKKTIIIILSFSIFLPSFLSATDKTEVVSTKKTKVKSEIQSEIVPEGFYVNMWNKFKNGTLKDKEKAISSLKAVVAKNFNELKAHYYLGIMYYEIGEYSLALTYFQNSLSGKDDADIYTRIGETQDKLNNKKEAQEAFHYALAINPNIPSALSKLGEYDYEKGDFDNAFIKLNKAIELDENNSFALTSLGKIYVLKTNANMAINLLRKAIELNDNNPESYLWLGKACNMSNKHKEAIENFNKAIDLSNNNEKIIKEIEYCLAQSLFENGENEKAISAYKKTMKISENKGDGYYGIGNVYENMGDVTKAVNNYIKAYKSNPKKYADKIEALASYYAEKEEYEKAKKLYALLKKDYSYKKVVTEAKKSKLEEEKTSKIVEYEVNASASNATDYDIESNYLALFELDKTNPEAAERLMNYYKERGYYDEALKWFKKYNKLKPTSDYNRKLIEQDLKQKLENDNILLYGKYSSKKSVSKSFLSNDELYNIALHGNNDRLKENAFKILIKRDEYKENANVYEDMMNFYINRGKRKEALKCVSKMKSLGLISESEVEDKRNKINNN